MRGKSNGAAILAAMLITATVASLATGMLAQINHWFSRSESARNVAQAQSLANAAVRWAAQYLAEESRLGPLDHLGELWATGLPPTPIEGGTLGGALTDAQSRFNLNNIIKDNGEPSEPDVEFAQRLFAQANLSAAQFSALLAARQRAKLTAFDVPARLANVATALPARSAINVNTANGALLNALAPDTKPQAWQARAVKPFESVAQFTQAVAQFDGRLVAPNVEIAVATRFFEIDTAATFGNERAGARALIDRSKGVVWQIAR
jgi:type II secretory pathway component PulK